MERQAWHSEVDGREVAASFATSLDHHKTVLNACVFSLTAIIIEYLDGDLVHYACGYMGGRVLGCPDPTLAEMLLHKLGVDVVAQQQGDSRVPEIVEPDSWQPWPLHNGVEGPIADGSTR